jgi:hypothetical protein
MCDSRLGYDLLLARIYLEFVVLAADNFHDGCEELFETPFDFDATHLPVESVASPSLADVECLGGWEVVEQIE